MLAREKAMDDAARLRATSITPFKPGAPGKLKDPRFQEKFDKAYYARANQIIDESKKKYGKNFGLVLSDPNTQEGREFVQEMANFETLRREFDEITDEVAAIDVGLESGELAYSDETMKIYDEYKGLLGQFEEGDIFKSRDLQADRDKLKGYLSLEHYLNSDGFTKNIMGEKAGYSWNQDKGEFYMSGTTHKVNYDEAIEEVTESLTSPQGPFAHHIRTGFMTKDDVKKVVASKFKPEKTVTSRLTKKAESQVRQEQVADAGFVPDDKREDNNYIYNDDGTVAGNAALGTVLYRHDMNLSGAKNRVVSSTPDGKTKTMDVSGIPLTQPMWLNGNSERNFEGNVYSKITGISTIKRGGKSYVVANTSSTVPTKTRYKKSKSGKITPVTQKEYETMKPSERKNVITRNEWKSVEIPVVLNEGGNETGTINEILNNVNDPTAKQNLQEGYNKAVESIELRPAKGQTQQEAFPGPGSVQGGEEPAPFDINNPQ
jgi:hypothetical protein